MIADPADLLDFARGLDARADAVGQLNDNLARRLEGAKWAGPGADQFRMRAGEFRAIVVHDVDRIRAAGAALRRLADQLTDELNTLKSIEADVLAWFATNHPELSPIPPPWPETDLPPTGDPRWREVQRAFAGAGITVGHAVTSAADQRAADAAAAAAAGAAGAAGAGRTEMVLGQPVTPAEKFIIDHENAGYDTSAYNPTPTPTGHAFGLGQLTDVIREKYLGADNINSTDPAQQIEAMRGYISDRYGTAEKAVEFWKQHRWY